VIAICLWFIDILAMQKQFGAFLAAADRILDAATSTRNGSMENSGNNGSWQDACSWLPV
jgi:hypothetical protein